MNKPPVTRKPGKRRIMVQLWGPLAKAIDRDFKALNIKRDRYLNDLFRSEIEELAKEVSFRNSDAVRARMQEQKIPERVKLTIELDEEVIERIDAVLAEKNIPRDSFVNRVLFFLVAKDSMLDRLDVAYERRGQVTAKPLSDAMGFLYDPFFHIREANEQRFYTIACFFDGAFGTKGPNLFALNTAISTDDWAGFNIDSDALLAELDLLSNGSANHD
ncbi:MULTISPECIES: hypothetical protein [unclassified Variovorax]|uniref:hypothetical protein n=1 Tax=unclassified Variovorax TaxID=663243 RepID=UPI00076D0EDE|nr:MULTISPECIES: hypothetical protein [unclassified Variovorax]KWT91753.1 hypothetical protein APY03_3190 [Variovorax sp. WDL1]PNG53306.1 hypothetical protein CHC06_04653 [Variovorax sp. B2]PNG53878.1 hypothetical protein CHC07_03700 [Variovorax sp. B4]VTV11343.1 hypothetical protein WDL1CHR_02214 [Variovorax sp. WDL1]